MQVLVEAWNLYRTMQHATPFETQVSDVLVLRGNDREAGKNGIAVVAMFVDSVAAVGRIAPDIGGKEFVLGVLRPFGLTCGASLVQALDFLEKGDVRIQLVQLFAQLMHDDALRELRQALVDVIAGDVQGRGHRQAVPR